ncbi:hypothetical protein C8J56DRAFT_949989 [Mycena floridula]|nr:hypothetical protein C8J56DRAFT_949989 [Mycena floridula]
MFSLFRSLRDEDKEQSSSSSAQSYSEAPPGWSAAPEKSHTFGLKAEAPVSSYDSSITFCDQFPPDAPRLFASALLDKVKDEGAWAWGVEGPQTQETFEYNPNPWYRLGKHNTGGFQGAIQNPIYGTKTRGIVTINTDSSTTDTCLLSTLPLVAGMYALPVSKLGVYYEVKVLEMRGTVAVGTACRPYPSWRLPGWNRLSAGLHLDDMRKFFEDGDGGKDYLPNVKLQNGDTVGVGFIYNSGTIFFTLNGSRLPDAFTGTYLPRFRHDVFAAIGIDGKASLEVNFGADLFRWPEGNEWGWRVEGAFGSLGDANEEALPSYSRML